MTKNPLNAVDGNNLTTNAPESSQEKYYNQFGLRHKHYIFKDFQDYMLTVFAEGDGSTVLDDEFPNRFDDWVQELEADDWLRFGNIYGNICKNMNK